jgi:UDP-N-acetylmuramoyl-L-alanyl-D-glutamate--2,6-diaminopimelate ligase
MSNLKHILSVLPDAHVTGDSDIEFRNIVYDSREVEPGDLFVALKGIGQDGHSFIPEATQHGAVAVMLEEDCETNGVVHIKVPNTRRALALLAAEYFGNPAQELTLIGITGTNGKTTISRLVKSILEVAGQKVGLIGTIEYWIGDERLPAGLTTPESLDLHGMFKKMTAQDIDSVVLEVSSHSLSLDRVFGLEFDVGVFSNLSRDHLDFHKTVDEYERVKSMLFESLDWARAKAVINRDDPSGRHMMEVSKAPVVSYGFDRESSVWANGFSLTANESHFTVHSPDYEFAVDFKLLGRFNVYNALASVGVGYAFNIDPPAMKEGLEHLDVIEGRFERIDCGQPFTVIIDYSHTPDALEHCLVAAREITRDKVIVVFGCGGDRDRGKRPLMGEVASRLADHVIVTSDNPRSEDPEKILRDIEEGFPARSRHEKIVDRREAIEKSLALAHQGDCVIIAGKGHEAYQIIGRDRLPFSDRTEVERVLKG